MQALAPDLFDFPWYYQSSQVGPGLHATISTGKGQIVGRLYGQNSVALAVIIVEAVNRLRGHAQIRVCALARDAVSLSS